MFDNFLEIFNNRGWKKNMRTIKLDLKEKCKYFHSRKLLFQSKERNNLECHLTHTLANSSGNQPNSYHPVTACGAYLWPFYSTKQGTEYLIFMIGKKETSSPVSINHITQCVCTSHAYTIIRCKEITFMLWKIHKLQTLQHPFFQSCFWHILFSRHWWIDCFCFKAFTQPPSDPGHTA